MDLNSLIGMDEAEACSQIIIGGFGFRILRRDQKYYAGTDDYRTDRINLQIDNGKITKAEIG